MLGQVVEVRLRRARDAAPVQAAGSHRRDRLRDVVGRPARIARRVHELRQAVDLVRLQHRDPGRRQHPQDGRRAEDRAEPDQGDLRPRRPGDEEDRGERGAVDERGSEVGLDEHEQDRDEGEAEGCEGRLPVAHLPRPVGEEAGQREDEEELPELGGLEAEEAQIDPALRPARQRGGEDDEDHQGDRPAVEAAPVAAVDGGVEEHGAEEPETADRRVHALADHVVVRVAGHVVARDARDRPQAVGDDAGDRRDERPVEAADERRLDARRPARPRSRVPCADVLDH